MNIELMKGFIVLGLAVLMLALGHYYQKHRSE